MIIAQLSDTHITPETTRADGRPSNRERMRRAVEHVLALPAPPAVVLVSGDCTDHGTAEEFEHFRELLRPLSMPVYVIPGNHDDRDRLSAAFGAQGERALAGFVQYTVEDWPVRLVALDTVIPGRDDGRLCPERLRWLDERLAEAPERPTLVVMHHPPFTTGLEVLDRLGLDGSEAFGAIIARHPQVERIVAGHIHCAMQRRFYGTLAMTCTSTALQIRIDLAQPRILSTTQEPAAGLVHVWSEHTGLVTHISPIGDHGPFQPLHDGSDWVR